MLILGLYLIGLGINLLSVRNDLLIIYVSHSNDLWTVSGSSWDHFWIIVVWLLGRIGKVVCLFCCCQISCDPPCKAIHGIRGWIWARQTQNQQNRSGIHAQGQNHQFQHRKHSQGRSLCPQGRGRRPCPMLSVLNLMVCAWAWIPCRIC